MKTAIFLSPYPDEYNIRDGYYQRVQNVDDKLQGVQRVYIEMGRKRNWQYSVQHPDPNVTVVRLNLFLHLRRLIALLTHADCIYIAAVAGFTRFFLPLMLANLTNTNIIFDVHGAGPEEAAYKGKRLTSQLYARLEPLIFAKMSTGLFVTEAMKTFYLHKYPFISEKDLIVLPNVAHLGAQIESSKHSQQGISQELGLSGDDVVFIYSGNIQKWQNIPLMLDAIKGLHNPRYRFIILTLHADRFQDLVEEYSLGNTTVRSVPPDELSNYYELAHYGFVLRDPHILNRVACPTKMIEYLHYGIVPIVKTEEIGDFNQLGYEFIKVEDLDDNLLARKSKKNQAIANRIVDQANVTKLSCLDGETFVNG